MQPATPPAPDDSNAPQQKPVLPYVRGFQPEGYVPAARIPAEREKFLMEDPRYNQLAETIAMNEQYRSGAPGMDRPIMANIDDLYAQQMAIMREMSPQLENTFVPASQGVTPQEQQQIAAIEQQLVQAAAPGGISAQEQTQIQQIEQQLMQLAEQQDLTQLMSPATPQVYYHGTANPEEVLSSGFNLEQAGQGAGTPSMYGKGVYMTNDMERAQDYGQPLEVGPGQANLKTVSSADIINTLYTRDTNYGDPDLIAQKIMNEGFDGLRIVNPENNAEEVVIYKPELVDLMNKGQQQAPDMMSPATPEMPPLELFHGSKSKFSQFDPKLMGTGEGADKFGQGAYLTSNEDIAKFYAETVAKKDFVKGYKDTGPLGTPEPIYEKDADTLAKEKAVVNKFIAKNLNLLDASTYKLEDEVKKAFEVSLTSRGYSEQDAKEEVDRMLNFARENKDKINDYRGELDYMINQLAAGDKQSTDAVIDAIKAKGYDGIKYLPAEKGEGYNYVIYNPEKLQGAEAPQEQAIQPKSDLLQEAKKYKSAEDYATAKISENNLPELKEIDNPEEYVKQLGFKVKKGDVDTEFWAKKSNGNQFYHVGPEEIMQFDKSQSRYNAKQRGGGITQINGLYLGRDVNALNDFYGMILKDEYGERPTVSSFKINAKWLDLSNTKDENKFIQEVSKKYNIPAGKTEEFGNALEQEVKARGYDGVRYFDPYATGEEFILVNEPKTKLHYLDEWNQAQKSNAPQEQPQKTSTINKIEKEGLLRPSSRGENRTETGESFKNKIDGVYAKTRAELVDKENLVEFRIPDSEISKIVVDDDYYDYITDNDEDIEDYVGKTAISTGSVAYKGNIPKEWITKIYDKNKKVIYSNPKATKIGKTTLYHNVWDKPSKK